MDGLVMIFQLIFILVLVPVGWLAKRYFDQRRRANAAEARANELERLLDARDRERERTPVHTPSPPARPHARHPDLARRRAGEPNGILSDPPSDLRAVRDELSSLSQDPYALFLGWRKVDGLPSGVVASLHGRSPYAIYHTLLTGQNRHGKDVEIAEMVLPVLERARPEQLQLCWLDGKRPDGALMRQIAHNWVEPCFSEDVPLVLPALRLERKRRERLLVEAGVTNWEELPEHDRPPMLLVFVSEVTLLADGLERDEKLERWLKVETASAAAGGMRYLMGIQNVANMETGWRDQCSLLIGGYQPAERLNLPNLGVSTDEIRRAGATPLHLLEERGYFTLRERGTILTVRSSNLSIEDRKAAIAALRDGRPGVSIRERLTELQAWAKAVGETVIGPQAVPNREPVRTAPIAVFPGGFEVAPDRFVAVRPQQDAVRKSEPPAEERTDDRRILEETSNLNPEQIDRAIALCSLWREQVHAWSNVGKSRSWMVAQMRPIERQVGFGVLTLVLGPSPRVQAVEEVV